MTNPRKVSLFRNGRNQAVRIPVEFELPGQVALLRREGQSLVIEPLPRQGLTRLLATMTPIDDPFPEIADPPLEPEDVF